MGRVIFAFALLLALSILAATPLTLSVKQTGPLVAQGGPARTPGGGFNLSMEARGADGKPIEDALIHARLWHINGLNFFTTDIPYVEGEPVFDFTTVAPNGTLHVEALTPIFGTYRLEARAIDPSGKNEPADISQDFEAAQLPEKSLNGALLLGAFLIAGVIGGYYFLSGGKHE